MQEDNHEEKKVGNISSVYAPVDNNRWSSQIIDINQNYHFPKVVYDDVHIN